MFEIKSKVLVILLLGVIQFAICDVNLNRFPQLENIKTKTSDSEQARAASEVISRILPNHADKFVVEIDSDFPENSFQIRKDNTTNGKVIVIGSSGTAACRGFNYYLKYYLHSQISWNTHQINEIPVELPDVDFNLISSNRFIYYQNVCTFSYSFVWWTWSDWEKHLDWMALQGINLFLAPVQEFVLSRVFKQLNLTDVEIDQHFAGPAFTTWQRMGNIRGWGGPLSMNYRNFSSNLQRQIIERARNLGMIVALPAFAGHLPVGLDKKFPQSKFTSASIWNGFPDKFCCPLYLDPTDSLFQCIGEMYLTEIVKEYGTDHVYFSDPFNELTPSSTDPAYIRDASKGIYQAMRAVDEKAVWLLQGWMFVNEAAFWTNDLIEAFLTANDIGTMLILDLQSEFAPQYERTNSFYGQPFIWCMLHNFGGTLGMHGSIGILNSRPMAARVMNNSTMVGFGLTPEGINQNYIMYEFAMEIGWEMTPKNITSWLNSYIHARYGHLNEDLLGAWSDLSETVYNYTGNRQIRGKFTFNKRPNVNFTPWTWYNSTAVKSSWKRFLDASSDFQNNTNFNHDLVDITRQYLQILMDQYWISIKDLYRGRKLNRFLKHRSDFEDILEDMELILRTNQHFSFGKWLDDAHTFAEHIGDGHLKDLYESNARYQITLWGPNGEIVDYANKQWAGIVKDFLLPRWKLFFDELIASIITHIRINNNLVTFSILHYIELPFVESKEYTSKCEGDAIQISRNLYDKWSNKDRVLGLPMIPINTDTPIRMKRKLNKLTCTD